MWNSRGVFAGLQLLGLKLDANVMYILYIIRSYNLYSFFGKHDAQRKAMEYDCHIFSKHLVFQMKNQAF